MAAPSSSIVPRSAGHTPVSTLISVDLPAPFCPMSAWTSPARRHRLTSSSARTPGKLRPMPRACSTHAGSGDMASILTGREYFFRARHRVNRLLGDDALRHRLARDDILHGGHELRPEERIALDRHVELARHHGFERALHAVDGDDEDVLPGLEPRLF